MNKKLLILLIALVSVLICLSVVVASDNKDLDVKSLQINKVKKVHTDSKGVTKKSTKLYAKFNVKSKSGDMKKYDVEIQCLDKKGKVIKTINSHIDKEGKNKIPLKDVSGVKTIKIKIKDSSGKEVYKGNTSKIKTTKKVTKDKPAKSKSKSSSKTYWGSSNSGKFHDPSCEWAQKISGRNKVVFHSRDEAVNSGYEPCMVCSP